MKADEHIGFHLRTADVLARRYTNSLNEESSVELLTGMQGWVIGYIYDHQSVDVFQRDLEGVFSVRRSTMTNMLKLMEKNGYITRQSVAQDARLKKIVLTQKAVLNHERVMANIRATEDRIAEGLTPEEIESFLRIVKKIEKNLDIENNRNGGTL